MRPGSVVAVALLSTVTITTPGHAAPTAKVWTCMRPAIKPQRIYLWCYHADIWTQGMRWSRRTARTVTASGDYVVNTCAISCAEGPFLKYPARFTFSRPEMVKAFRGYQTALRRNATMFRGSGCRSAAHRRTAGRGSPTSWSRSATRERVPAS